ncbi:MAG: DUF4332 domain-containing protein [Sandaracinaceae bacterium]
MAKIEDIEGIGPAFAAKLNEAGVKTVEGLLELGAQPKGRKDIAAASGISNDKILRWVNMADLFRIKGVGEEYADLLEASGVDTVVELGRRNAANLHKAMTELNAEKKLVRALPAEKTVEGWVAQAKELPRGVHF